MSPDEVLQFVLNRLEGCGIDYMLTGSFAGNLHGVPRTTYDADIVIEVDSDSLNEFVRNLGSAFYVSSDAARDVVSTRGMFNVIHLQTGFKVDFIVRKSRPFSKKEFSRRQKGTFCETANGFNSKCV